MQSGAMFINGYKLIDNNNMAFWARKMQIIVRKVSEKPACLIQQRVEDEIGSLRCFALELPVDCLWG